MARVAVVSSLIEHEAQTHSQHGEDGIIAEIFRRIGSDSQIFLEIGSGDGEENNTRALLEQGWSGVWIDRDNAAIARAARTFAREVRQQRLVLLNLTAEVEHIDALIHGCQSMRRCDLLSIDIDGNDLHVWNALTGLTPRAVVIEYNGTKGPEAIWVQPYDKEYVWDGRSDDFGASLEALLRLGREKHYSLVACDSSGANAFFIPEILARKHFVGPFTAAEHYRPLTKRAYA